MHVINLNDGGGAERFAMGLALNLPSDRFELFICSPRPLPDEVVGTLRAGGVQVMSLGRSGRYDAYRMAGLARLVRKHRIDILHAHLFGSNLWSSLVGRLCRVPVVLAHEHTWSYEGNPLRCAIDGYVIGRLATRFIAVSEADAERMRRIEHVPAHKVTLMPTAYVPHRPQPAVDLRAELGLTADAPLIASVAIMRPQKALDVLVEAHRIVLRSLPDAHLVFVGGGECRDAIETLVVDLGLEANVHFLGHRTDVDGILKTVDVCVLASDFEGTPLIAFEAMANLTPFVATAVGGLPDIIDDGRTGLLVPPRRPDLLASALIRVLSDPGAATAMAAAAAESLAPYQIDAVARRFAEFYERLAAEVDRGPRST